MFDTMTLTKATGAVCGSLLIYLFGTWAADSLYATAPAAHGDEEVAQAYTIEIEDAAPVEAAAEGPAFAEVYAAADVTAGEKVFGKCKACHKIDGVDGTGPHLNGVVNRATASIAGYGYSEVLASKSADVWSPENLEAFLLSPKTYAPGTKMSFAGLPKVEDRANVIAYLATLQ